MDHSGLGIKTESCSSHRAAPVLYKDYLLRASGACRMSPSSALSAHCASAECLKYALAIERYDRSIRTFEGVDCSLKT